MIIKLLILIFVYCYSIHTLKTIKTKNGPVTGRTIKLFDTYVTEYLGIPFAKPPISDLRFRPPQPLKEPAWRKVLRATKPAKACLQSTNLKGYEDTFFFIPKEKQSEDCLQLNMWVPKKPNGAVIVFIFGGGFKYGSPSLPIYNGSVLAAKTDTIVVNLNYRLGIFGLSYMCCGNDIKGNMALLDQQMGMRWVYRNIKKFGGNAKKITLYGIGTGSVSVTAHLFSRDSSKYFNRIIASSGVITNIWAKHRPQYVDDTVRIAAISRNCFGKHHDIYKCLIKLNASDLLELNEKYSKKVGMTYGYGFNVISKDDVFFKGEIYEKFQSRNMKTDVDIMIGMTNNEKSLFLPTVKHKEFFSCDNNDTKLIKKKKKKCKMGKTKFHSLLRYLTSSLGCNSTENQHLLKKYETKKCKKNYKKCALDFLSDVAFNCDILRFTRRCAFITDGYIYSYFLKVSSSSINWPAWMKSSYGIELEYVFGLPYQRPELYNKKLLEKEKEFSKKVMKLFAKFAEKGKPGKGWKKFNPYDMKTAIIDFSLLKKKRVKHIKQKITDKCKLLEKYTSKYIMY